MSQTQQFHPLHVVTLGICKMQIIIQFRVCNSCFAMLLYHNLILSCHYKSSVKQHDVSCLFLLKLALNDLEPVKFENHAYGINR